MLQSASLMLDPSVKTGENAALLGSVEQSVLSEFAELMTDIEKAVTTDSASQDMAERHLPIDELPSDPESSPEPEAPLVAEQHSDNAIESNAGQHSDNAVESNAEHSTDNTLSLSLTERIEAVLSFSQTAFAAKAEVDANGAVSEQTTPAATEDLQALQAWLQQLESTQKQQERDAGQNIDVDALSPSQQRLLYQFVNGETTPSDLTRIKNNNDEVVPTLTLEQLNELKAELAYIEQHPELLQALSVYVEQQLPQKMVVAQSGAAVRAGEGERSKGVTAQAGTDVTSTSEIHVNKGGLGRTGASSIRVSSEVEPIVAGGKEAQSQSEKKDASHTSPQAVTAEMDKKQPDLTSEKLTEMSLTEQETKPQSSSLAEESKAATLDTKAQKTAQQIAQPITEEIKPTATQPSPNPELATEQGMKPQVENKPGAEKAVNIAGTEINNSAERAKAEGDNNRAASAPGTNIPPAAVTENSTKAVDTKPLDKAVNNEMSVAAEASQAVDKDKMVKEPLADKKAAEEGKFAASVAAKDPSGDASQAGQRGMSEEHASQTLVKAGSASHLPPYSDGDFARQLDISGGAKLQADLKQSSDVMGRVNLHQPQQAVEQMKQEVNLLMAKGLQQAEIRLDPAELGSMQIKLQVNQDQASVQIHVQNPQAKELLDQTLPRLREMLAQQGINLGEADIRQQQQQHSGAQSGEQHANQGARSMSQEIDGAPVEAERIQLQYSSESGIDYYA